MRAKKLCIRQPNTSHIVTGSNIVKEKALLAIKMWQTFLNLSNVETSALQHCFQRLIG